MSGPHQSSANYFHSSSSAGFQQRGQQQQYHHAQQQQPSHQQAHHPHHQQAAAQHHYGSYDAPQQQQYQHHAPQLDYHNSGNSSYGMGFYQPMSASHPSSGPSGYGAMSSDAHAIHQQHQQHQQHGQHGHHQSAPYHSGSNDDVYGHSHVHHSMDSQQQHSGMPASSSSSSAPQHHQQQQQSQSPPQQGNTSLPDGIRPKRRQVKNACINCQKACKKCDEGRPCTRCVKYGLTDTCIDSMRKERKRGIKRGPYKRRATTGSANAPQNGSASTTSNTSYDHKAESSSHSYETSNGSSSHTGAGSSYDSSGYPMSAPTSYRNLPATSSAGSNGNGNGYGFTSSPSLFPREQLRNNVWGSASSPIDAHSRLPQTGAPSSSYPQSMYGGGALQESRSASAPLGAQGSPVSSTFNSAAAGRPGMTASPSIYGAHPLPSPSAIGSMLASGGGRGGALFSPPALPSSNSYLSAASSSSRGGGLNSADSLSYGSSSGSSANFSSPRTPLSAGGNLGDGGSMPPPLHDGSAASVPGPYIKSPSAYVHHPPSTTSMAQPGLASMASRPFPLQMPQFPRARTMPDGGMGMANGLGVAGMGGAMKAPLPLQQQGHQHHQQQHVRTPSAGVVTSTVEA